jgi:hypothetical protein
MPRLSVDIDLTYVAFDARDIAFANIAHALLRIQKEIQKSIPVLKSRLYVAVMILRQSLYALIKLPR